MYRRSLWTLVAFIALLASADLAYAGPCLSEPLGSPLESLVATSGYGLRYRDISLEPTAHFGVDFRAAPGTPVYAADLGRVTHADWATRTAGGIYVKIQHSSTRETQYMHLSVPLVSVGDFVLRGQLIGFSGTTNGTLKNQSPTVAPHLHFAYLINGTDIDPMPCLPYAESIDVEPSAPILDVSEQESLEANVVLSNTGEEIPNRSILWRSLTPEIVTVNKFGTIDAVANGVGQIEVSASLSTAKIVTVYVGQPLILSFVEVPAVPTYDPVKLWGVQCVSKILYSKSPGHIFKSAPGSTLTWYQISNGVRTGPFTVGAEGGWLFQAVNAGPDTGEIPYTAAGGGDGGHADYPPYFEATFNWNYTLDDSPDIRMVPLQVNCVP